MSEYGGVCTQEVGDVEERTQSGITTSPWLEINERGIWNIPKAKRTPTVDVFDIDASDTCNDWLQDALRALATIENLPDNWDSNDAESPNQTAIQNCQLVLTQLVKANLKPSLIEPSTDDGIAVGFWAENRYADIECLNDGEILAMTHDRGVAEPEIWEIHATKMSETIKKIKKFLEK